MQKDSVTLLERVFGYRERRVAGCDGAISVGDRYISADKRARIWVVESIRSIKSSNYPLIALHREDRPDMGTIVSASALDGTGRFRRSH